MDYGERIWKFYKRAGRIHVGGKAFDCSQHAPNLDMMIWRVILSERISCSLVEFENGTYNIGDLLDMHEALDLMEAMRKDNGDS